MSEVDVNSEEYSMLPLKNLASHADIWLNYCKLEKNGVVQDPDMVYCTKCLEEQGVKKKFLFSSSVDEVRDHLVSVHQMAQFLQENDTMEISTTDVVVETETDSHLVEYLECESENNKSLNNHSQKGSAVWKYFNRYFDEKQQKEYVCCCLCLESDKVQKYQSSTATSNLMKHLKTHHQHELIKMGAGTEPDMKRTFVKTSGVWKYFCKLTKNNQILDENHIYCGICLEKNVNKKYRTSTSTGSLKKHLQLFHNITLDSENTSSEAINVTNIIKLDTKPINISNMIKLDTKSKKPQSSVRIYYHKLGSDDKHVYCLFCLHQKRYQRYCISTSTSALRTHLISKHNHHPDENDCPSLITDLKSSITSGNMDFTNMIDEKVPTNDNTEDLNDSMIEYVEELEEDEFEIPSIVQPETPKKANKPVIKVEKYCRACGQSPGCYTKLSTRFEDDETPQTTLSTLYFEVIGVDPKQKSSTSVLICYECEAKLKQAFKFKQLALFTEQMMTEDLKDDDTHEKNVKHDTYEMVTEEFLDEGTLDESITLSNHSMEEEHDEDFENTDNFGASEIVAVPVNELSQPEPSNFRKRLKILQCSDVKHIDESDTELEYCEKRFDPEIPEEVFYADPACDDCSTKFETYDLLLDHNLKAHGNQYPYKAICRKRFASRKELQSHVDFMHKKQNCEKCHVDFVNQDQYQLHSVIHDDTSKIIGLQLGSCEECGVSFANDHSLMLHMEEHNRFYSCQHCSAKFKEQKAFVNHIYRRHKFTCGSCGAAYATQNLLKIHERSHSGVRPFKCSMCPKSLISAEGLKVHLKYVHKAFGSTDKSCKICKKTFTSKNGLVRHNRLHSGNFVKCTLAQCGKKFTSNFDLKNHIQLVHNDVRAYQCQECPKRYKSNAHLTKHVETEHLKLRFVCPLCDKTITNRWDFNHHVKRVHPDKLDTKATILSQKDS